MVYRSEDARLSVAMTTSSYWSGMRIEENRRVIIAFSSLCLASFSGKKWPGRLDLLAVPAVALLTPRSFTASGNEALKLDRERLFQGATNPG
jgi:hypothetical protein